MDTFSSSCITIARDQYWQLIPAAILDEVGASPTSRNLSPEPQSRRALAPRVRVHGFENAWGRGGSGLRGCGGTDVQWFNGSRV